MLALLLLSFLGSFGGIKALVFPIDVAIIFPLSVIVLYFSQKVIVDAVYHEKVLSNALLAETIES